MFIYDVLSLAFIILLGILITCVNRGYGNIVGISLSIAVISMVLIYALMFTGLGYLISGGIIKHIFGILVMAVPMMIGQSKADKIVQNKNSR